MAPEVSKTGCLWRRGLGDSLASKELQGGYELARLSGTLRTASGLSFRSHAQSELQTLDEHTMEVSEL
jgi:hypothetical protein